MPRVISASPTRSFEHTCENCFSTIEFFQYDVQYEHNFGCEETRTFVTCPVCGITIYLKGDRVIHASL